MGNLSIETRPAGRAHILVGGDGLRADPGAMVGYEAERGVPGPLVLGYGACIRSGSVIYTGSSIGAGLETGHGVVIREECQIGSGVSIWSHSVIDYRCRIGDDVKVHSNCYVAQFTAIGDRAFIAPGVAMANDLYPGDPASAARLVGPVIGAAARIGAGVTLLPGVRIGPGALVGAGSVVTHDIDGGAVAYGVPASVRGRTDELTPIEACDHLQRPHPLRSP